MDKSDEGVRAKSEFGRKVNGGLLRIPAAEPVASCECAMPYVFVGDEAFIRDFQHYKCILLYGLIRRASENQCIASEREFTLSCFN